MMNRTQKLLKEPHLFTPLISKKTYQKPRFHQIRPQGEFSISGNLFKSSAWKSSQTATHQNLLKKENNNKTKINEGTGR